MHPAPTLQGWWAVLVAHEARRCNKSDTKHTCGCKLISYPIGFVTLVVIHAERASSLVFATILWSTEIEVYLSCRFFTTMGELLELLWDFCTVLFSCGTTSLTFCIVVEEREAFESI